MEWRGAPTKVARPNSADALQSAPAMNELGRNVRFAFRTLFRTPGPAVAAVLSLAIGIGANTALFSVVNGLLLKPLPYPDPDRLGLIWLHSPGIGIFQDWPSPGQFLDIKAQNRSFDDMAIMHGSAQTLTGGAESARVQQLRTTPNLFAMLGATTILGRLPTADDDLPGKPRVGVLSHGFWQQQFGGDPTIVGRNLTVNGAPLTVIGVLRPELIVNNEVVPTVGGSRRSTTWPRWTNACIARWRVNGSRWSCSRVRGLCACARGRWHLQRDVVSRVARHTRHRHPDGARRRTPCRPQDDLRTGPRVDSRWRHRRDDRRIRIDESDEKPALRGEPVGSDDVRSRAAVTERRGARGQLHPGSPRDAHRAVGGAAR